MTLAVATVMIPPYQPTLVTAPLLNQWGDQQQQPPQGDDADHDQTVDRNNEEPRRNGEKRQNTNNVYALLPRCLSAGQILRRSKLIKLNRQLLEVIGEIFVKPEAIYVKQDSDS